MTLAKDLLEQARHLARRETAKPRQASLRRALSAAYYALFHRLIDASRRFLVGTKRDRRHLRDMLARCYEHGAMNKAAQEFAQGASSWLQSGSAVSQDLKAIAQTFTQAQRSRHAADYDLTRPFTRQEVLSEIARVERAFMLWDRVAGQPDSNAFLLALLLKPRR